MLSSTPIDITATGGSFIIPSSIEQPTSGIMLIRNPNALHSRGSSEYQEHPHRAFVVFATGRVIVITFVRSKLAALQEVTHLQQ